MEAYKKEITHIVKKYIKENKEEFELFKKSKKIKYDEDLLYTKYTEVKNSDFVIRALYELPEKLYFKLKMGLSEDARKWLETKKGGRWFAKTFIDFKTTYKV